MFWKKNKGARKAGQRAVVEAVEPRQLLSAVTVSNTMFTGGSLSTLYYDNSIYYAPYNLYRPDPSGQLTVNPALTIPYALELELSTTTLVPGEPLTLTARVSKTDSEAPAPSGQVTFRTSHRPATGISFEPAGAGVVKVNNWSFFMGFAIDDRMVGTADVVDGVATLELASLEPGHHAFYVSYSANGEGSVTSGQTTAVVKAETVFTLKTSPLGAKLAAYVGTADGRLFQVPGTISSSSDQQYVHGLSTAGMPSGTLTLKRGDEVLANVDVRAGFFDLQALVGYGAHALTVEYDGDENYLPASQVIDVNVVAPTTTTLHASIPAPGQPVSVTARVAVEGDGHVATGSVSFFAQVYGETVLTPLGSAPVVDGTAAGSLDVSKLSPNQHYAIVASYSGDAVSRESHAYQYVFVPEQTAVVLKSWGGTTASNPPVFTATVTRGDGAMFPSFAWPTIEERGEIQSAGCTLSVTIPLPPPPPPKPVIPVTPVMPGITLPVAPPANVPTINIGGMPHVWTGSLWTPWTVVNSTIGTSYGGYGSSGSLTLSGSSSVDASFVRSSGNYGLFVGLVKTGAGTLYLGNGTWVNNNAVISPTTIAYTEEQPVAVALPTLAPPPAAPVPAGGVTFMDGDRVLAIVPIDATGTATFAPGRGDLGLGEHAITAVYSGDASFFNAVSSIVPMTIAKGTTTTAVSATSTLSKRGQVVRLSIGVTSQQKELAKPTGTIFVYVDRKRVAVLRLGAARNLVLKLKPGKHQIKVVYSGDMNFDGSISAIQHIVPRYAAKSLAKRR